MSDTTHIALALHDRHGTYWPYVAVTVTSVCQHTSVPVVVHLLHDETLSDEARQVLGQIVSHYGHRLELHAVPTIESLSALDFRHFSVATAYRLILPRLLPHLPWLVYLDADIVFHGFDLAQFGQGLQAQTHDHPLAAVHDDLFASFAGGRTDLHALNLAAADYVNAGVLVMRPALIAQDLLAELPAFSARHPKVTHLDQGLLNDVFRGRIQRMPPQFNRQVNLMFGRCFEPLDKLEGQVLHYSGKVKPLSGKFSPADLCFWRYTQHIPDISCFVAQPMSYLQKIHTGHSHARVVPSVERLGPTA
jgi:lipopolysaccharide biosynthesis glycosyltransferase